jgi:hypothetical protein
MPARPVTPTPPPPQSYARDPMMPRPSPPMAAPAPPMAGPSPPAGIMPGAPSPIMQGAPGPMMQGAPDTSSAPPLGGATGSWAKGGPVNRDTKPRYKGTIHKGR